MSYYVGDAPPKTAPYEPNKRFRIVANENLTYVAFNHVIGRLRVKPGYVFDGASIPRWAWFLAGHPFDNDNLQGALAHDILYETQPQGVSRRMADRELLMALEVAGVNFARRRAIYHAVRVGGLYAWKTADKRRLARMEMLYA